MEICKVRQHENTLLSKKVGQVFEVECFGKRLEERYLRRLLEVGLTRGTKVRVLRKSVRGKTYLIEVRGVVFSLQKEILGQIFVR